MGYRSEVVLAIDADHFNELKKTQLLTSVLPELMREAIRHENGGQSNFHESKSHVTFSWSDIKWYESHSRIQEIIRFIDRLEPSYYNFCRVGEDAGDTEQEGDGEYLYLSTSIEEY
jgi:hypothetical protein